MQPGQYIVIKVADIEEKINDMQEKWLEYMNKGDNAMADILQNKIFQLKCILTNPTDLYGVV